MARRARGVNEYLPLLCLAVGSVGVTADRDPRSDLECARVAHDDPNDVRELKQKRSCLCESDIEQRDALLRRCGRTPMPFGAERAAEVGEDGLHGQRVLDGGDQSPRWSRRGTRCRSPP